MKHADNLNKKHIHLGVSLALIIVFLAGCSTSNYVHEYPKWSEVAPTAPLPIDGEWKSSKGAIVHFEKGKGRFLNINTSTSDEVTYKNIRRVAPGEYKLESASWNNRLKVTAFGTGEIQLLSPTEIVIRDHANRVTNYSGYKDILTNIRFDNEPSFLQELRHMGMKADSSSSDGTASSEHKSPLAINIENAMRKAENYTIGRTTIDEFMQDGWSVKSAYIGKVGIVTFIRKDDNYDITLGILATDAINEGEIYQSIFEKMLARGDVELRLTVKESRARPVDITPRLCIFTFKKTLLSNKQCGMVKSFPPTAASDPADRIAENAGLSPLFTASLKGEVNRVKSLMKNGADVNERTKKGGATALHAAATVGEVEVIRLLNENGADIDAQISETGYTALMIAVSFGHAEAVQMLVDNGANLNATNKDGMTAIALARKENNPAYNSAILQLLLDRSTDLNSKIKHNCISGNCANGFGTCTFHKGEWAGGKYEGQFKDSERNGQGTHTWASGSKYVGQWRNDKRNGQGTMSFGKGEWAGHEYVGQWKEDKRDGQGTFYYANGRIVTGLWKDDKRITIYSDIEQQAEQSTGDTIATVALPANGSVRMYVDEQRLAPLQIVTKGQDVHYLVKLLDWNTNQPVQTIFVRSGHRVDTKVPLGLYRLKYAAGDNWLGDKELFGDSTIYKKAKKRFDFQEKDTQVTGYYVELIFQPGGNLPTTKILKSEW
jgi:hypothetical protein